MASARRPSRLWAMVVVAAVLALLLGGRTFWLGRQAPSTRLTAEERDWLRDNQSKLTLFYNTDFPPIEYAGPNGAFVGLGADVVAKVERRLGVTFAKQPCSDWNRHLEALESGECAVAPTIVRTPDRERFASFSAPYATAPVAIITRRETEGDLTLDDLVGRRVLVVSGYATDSYVRDRARGRFEVVSVQTVSDGLRAVSFGVADALVENLAVAAYYIEQDGLPNLHVAGSTDYSFDWCIGVSRQYPLLASAVCKAVAQIPESELETTRRRWISLGPRRGLDRETVVLLELTAAFIAALLVSLAAITFLLKRRLNEKVASLRLSQQELLDQTERLELATEATNAGIWDIHPDTGVAFYGEHWYAMLGYAPVDGQARIDDWISLIHPADRPAAEQALGSYLDSGGQGGLEIEFRMRQSDGMWRWVLGKGRAIAWGDNGRPSRVIGLNVDIQKHKEVQDALLESERTFRQAIEALPLGCVITDRRGVAEHANRAFTETLGYSVAEIADPDDWSGRAYPDEDYRRYVLESWQAATADPEAADSARTHEFDVTAKDGRVRRIEFRLSLLADRLLLLLDDTTDRHRAEEERERLRSDLAQAQKMETVGRLAGGVAHDFNNMLGVILGHAELALGGAADSAPLASHLKEIRGAAQRSADLTRQLLAFARQQTIAPRPLDLNATVETMLGMLRRLIGEDTALVWLPGAAVWQVSMDPTQIAQILTNLCVNARDALTGPGTVTIETGNAVLDVAECEDLPGAAPGEYATLTVSDTGRGMGREVLAHIFEPFFTTKGVGEGTGLGLATTYGIVSQNSGCIAVTSMPGVGSSFRICLPRCMSDAATRADVASAPPTGGPETVLLVEDEPAILALTAAMLEQLGYRVLSAGTPEDAIRIATAHEGAIDLLLTDVVMPEMTGRDLVARLLSLHPCARQVFMSGYPGSAIAHHGVLDEAVHFLQKPFSLSDLASKLREALAGDRPAAGG